jgi:hypothetical protein
MLRETMLEPLSWDWSSSYFDCPNDCGPKAIGIYFSKLKKERILPHSNDFHGSSLHVICERVNSLQAIPVPESTHALSDGCTSHDYSDDPDDSMVQDLQDLCSGLLKQSRGEEEVDTSYLCLDCLKRSVKAPEAMDDCRVAHGEDEYGEDEYGEDEYGEDE